MRGFQPAKTSRTQCTHPLAGCPETLISLHKLHTWYVPIYFAETNSLFVRLLALCELQPSCRGSESPIVRLLETTRLHYET